MASSGSSGTYVGRGETDAPIGRSLDAAISSFSAGGARVVPLVTAALQMDILRQNVGLAKNYYNTNHQDFVFWQTTYQPKMLSALNESKARAYYTDSTFTPQYGALDYLASTGRGQSKASFRLDREWLNTRRKISKYNVGHGRRVDYKYAMAKFNSELEGWNIGFRFEDNRKMLYDEQRHAHQAEILNIGIGAGNAARQGLATSVTALSEARSQKAGFYGSLSNGLATFAGFNDRTQGIMQAAQNKRDYGLATAGKPVGVDVTKDQMDRAGATV